MEKTAEEIKAENEAIEQAKNEAQRVTESNTELIEARKKAAQAEMRANQLANQLAEREKKEEEARQKQLEENNEFKTLYEREKEAREKLLAERQDEETKQSVIKAKGEVFSGYAAEVVELAEATGIDLYDDSDESKSALKAKLDIIASKINPTDKKVHGNNPVTPIDEKADNKTLLQRMRYDDRTISRNARRSVIGQLPELATMRAMGKTQE